MNGAVLEAQALSKRFGAQAALSDVSARLEVGTIGLVGPNGAGKTTLLRLLMGLIPPTTGAARVMGYDPREQPLEVRERVGYMPEHDCLIPSMSAVGFVSYMGRVSGLPREASVSRAHDVLQFVGIREARYRRIEEYSVGMRQRVKLAQALVHDPPVCILDEPTAGLDPRGRTEMLQLLQAIARLGNRTLVISTHLLPDVEGLCDQILMLDAGRLLASGSLSALLRASQEETVIRFKGEAEGFLAALKTRGMAPRLARSEVRLNLPPGGTRPVFEAASEARVQVRLLGPSVRTVEDLFLSLVERAPLDGAR